VMGLMDLGVADRPAGQALERHAGRRIDDPPSLPTGTAGRSAPSPFRPAPSRRRKWSGAIGSSGFSCSFDQEKHPRTGLRRSPIPGGRSALLGLIRHGKWMQGDAPCACRCTSSSVAASACAT
jgi:hypothetical protein